MGIKKYIPIIHEDEKPSFASLSKLQSDIDVAFSNFGLPRMEDVASVPAHRNRLLESKVEINETDSAYIITVDVAGVAEDRVKLAMARNLLIIKGEKQHDSEYHEGHFSLREHSYSSFERSLSLPHDVDGENISAQFRNERLVITLLRKSGSPQNLQSITIDRSG